jgi:hypothetical protein
VDKLIREIDARAYLPKPFSVDDVARLVEGLEHLE